MTVRILQGDCREVMRTLANAGVDAIVTDPPYELTSARPGGRSEATRGKVMGGFMGMKWDGTGVAFDACTWREALRVLKPGGHLLAFSGTRTYHRMVCAIEDAGFEIRDQLAWIYGSGFPKSRNLDGDWNGWGTALKPAWEPIVLARKPMPGTVAANVALHRTGALNIDGCRVPVDDAAYARNCSGDRGHAGTRSAAEEGATNIRAGGGQAADGRWPANIVHDGSDEVLQAFPNATGQKADLPDFAARVKAGRNTYNPMRASEAERLARGDTGSAARFFYCAKADRGDRNEGLGDPGPQFKRGSTLRDAERVGEQRKGNHHPTVKPTDLMRWLCRLVTPPGGLVLDPFMGSGSTLKAAELEGFSAIGIELDPAYIEIARRRVGADAPLLADVEVTA